MTKLQYLRWKFFAIGMAKHCFLKATESRRSKLLDELEEYLNWIGEPWGDAPPEYSEFTSWDENIIDHVESYFSQYYHEDFNGRERGNKYLNQLQCCLRAGVDVAVSPSGGVVGFTLGDVKNIFHRHLPLWVRAFWEHDPRIDTLPDDTPVWL